MECLQQKQQQTSMTTQDVQPKPPSADRQDPQLQVHTNHQCRKRSLRMAKDQLIFKIHTVCVASLAVSS